MDMGSLRQELQLPHHFIMGGSDLDLDEDIMMLGSTPQVDLQPVGTFGYRHACWDFWLLPCRNRQHFVTLCHEMDMTTLELKIEE